MKHAGNKLKRQLFNIAKVCLDIVSHLLTKPDNNTYLEIHLKGGLCNKLFCLISACEIAQKHGLILVEPYFGWKEKILFSKIYDINFFNEMLKPYNNNKDIILSRKKLRYNARKKRNIKKNEVDLYEYAVAKLNLQREQNIMSLDCMNILVLKALKLNVEFRDIVATYTEKHNFNALQVRIESDWVNYAKNKKVGENEILLVDINNLTSMIKDFDDKSHLFFTTGENHEMIESKFQKEGFKTSYFYDAKYEYEINGAINFEICSKAKKFIGLSRSTYSNLISLKRSLTEKEESYIYNFNNKIIERIDKGLHPEAIKSINCSIELI